MSNKEKNLSLYLGLLLFVLISMWIKKNAGAMKLPDFGISTHTPQINPFRLQSWLFYDKTVLPYFLLTSA